MTLWFATVYMFLALFIGIFSSPTDVQTESILKRDAEERVLDLSLPASLKIDDLE
jgi:hypothetical protein